MKPFRFAVQCPGAASWRQWSDQARRIESLGFSTLTMPDHLGDQLSAGPALAAAAAVTTDLRIGTVVANNDLRHPALLAKEAATLHLLSEGRFELGIGAGWLPDDYRQLGMDMDPPGVRISRLAEAADLLGELLAGREVTSEGDHYRLDSHRCLPEVARPGPQLMIGGGGRRVLELAAARADIVGINLRLAGGGATASADATAEQTDLKLGWVRSAAGAREPEVHVRVHFVQRTDDRAGLAAAVAGSFGLTTAQALDTPFALVGEVSEICDQLVERRERWGMSYIGIGIEALEDMAPVVNRLAGT